MTGEELEGAMLKLREFAIAQGMPWVLDEIDEAIALGVPETRRLRQTTDRQGQTRFEDVTDPDLLQLPDEEQGRRTRRSEEFTRTRPMTVREQTELLIQALSKVLLELDAIADGSLDALDPASLYDYVDPTAKPGFPVSSMPGVGTISFAPDEGSTAPAVSTEVIRGSRRRARVAELFGAIEAEIDS
jgi:hypothetical protein